MAFKEKVETLLEAMVDIVNEDNQPWTDKRDVIKAVAKKNERYETALCELLSWFEEDAF